VWIDRGGQNEKLSNGDKKKPLVENRKSQQIIRFSFQKLE